MSRVKEERLLGEGDNGQDLIRYIDTVSGETIKEVSVRPAEGGEKVKKSRKPREIITDKPLLSAEEMTNLAVKMQGDTVGKKVREVIRGMLDRAEENVLSGKYTHTLDKDEINLSLSKDVITTLKGLGYSVRKKITDDGINLTIAWKTAKPKKAKLSTERNKKTQERAQVQAPDSEMTFEFEPKKTS